MGELRAGRSYIRHVPAARLQAVLRPAPPPPDGPAFDPTDDYSLLVTCDAILTCLPTPLTENREPDLSDVTGTADTMARYLRPGQLIVLESTRFPGTTDEIVRPTLEATGLKVGKDLHLAFSPEREDPNDAQYNTKTIPKLVGGCTPPFYLTWKVRQYELTTRFIELAGEINHAMPAFVIEKLTDALNERRRSLKGSRVVVLGVAYKRDLDDTRESPALKIIDLLTKKGAEVAYHDRYVPVLKPSRRKCSPVRGERAGKDRTGMSHHSAVRRANLLPFLGEQS